MTKDYEQILKDGENQHIRVNKFLAQRDPLYEEKYRNKRSELLAEIMVAEREVRVCKSILEDKEEKHTKLIRQLEALDQARKDWEAM